MLSQGWPGPWAWLVAAGVFEVVWVVLLKQSDGFTRLAWSAATVAAMGFSFYCMSQSLRALPMGTVYAVWTGIGAAGGLFWGIVAEGEPDPSGGGGIAGGRLSALHSLRQSG